MPRSDATWTGWVSSFSRAGHHPALRARGRRTARPGLDALRPARHEHPLYQHVFQVRQQDISNIKMARTA
jgi:hypothetical protein